MYAICVINSSDLTNICLEWAKNEKEAQLCRDKWEAYYEGYISVNILDNAGVSKSMAENRFKMAK